jgi:hypothetical protein
MDNYAAKIKVSAEHLIRIEFPEKALELDTLVSVSDVDRPTGHVHYRVDRFCQGPMLSFSEVSKVRTETRLPTVADLISYTNDVGGAARRRLVRRTNVVFQEQHKALSSVAATKKRRSDSTETSQVTPTKGNVGDGTAIYVFNGVVPSNPLITLLEDKLKPYIFHFLDSVRVRSVSVVESNVTSIGLDRHHQTVDSTDDTEGRGRQQLRRQHPRGESSLSNASTKRVSRLALFEHRIRWPKCEPWKPTSHNIST